MTTPDATPLPSRPISPLPLAVEAASVAVAYARGKGLAVTAVVLDNEGILKVALWADASRPYLFDSARMKAYAAINAGAVRDVDTPASQSSRY